MKSVRNRETVTTEGVQNLIRGYPGQNTVLHKQCSKGGEMPFYLSNRNANIHEQG